MGNDTYELTLPVTSVSGKVMKPIVILTHKSQILIGMRLQKEMNLKIGEILLGKGVKIEIEKPPTSFSLGPTGNNGPVCQIGDATNNPHHQ